MKWKISVNIRRSILCKDKNIYLYYYNNYLLFYFISWINLIYNEDTSYKSLRKTFVTNNISIKLYFIRISYLGSYNLHVNLFFKVPSKTISRLRHS